MRNLKIINNKEKDININIVYNLEDKYIKFYEVYMNVKIINNSNLIYENVIFFLIESNLIINKI